MAKQEVIGIPRALLYYKYRYLWECFFKELGCHILLSPETNKEIMDQGINHSIDESCLSAKIYMGHIYAIINQVDYIFVPRFCNFARQETVCTKFNALYDIVRNTFPHKEVLHYNVDVLKRNGELKGFIKMGLALKKNFFLIVKAYIKAKLKQKHHDKLAHKQQADLINNESCLKMLIVAHPYNRYDKLVGFPIIKYLMENNIMPVYADIVDHKVARQRSLNISKTLHWTYSKELIGAIDYYQDKIDGIIFISTFPCGPDSLVNELCLRKIKYVPMLNLVLDELQGEAGLHTRLESFIDIIKIRKNKQEAVS